MECVFVFNYLEYVLDFELERPTSAKSLETKYFLKIKANILQLCL